MLKVLIADDHPVVRRGLRELIEEAFGTVKIEEAGTGQDVLDLVQQGHWDILVLDINLPDQSGLEVLKALKTSYPQLPVIILSMYPENQYAVRAFRAGAAGYLTKESAPEELGKAMKKALAGGRYVSAAVAERLAVDLHDLSTRAAHERLSDREFEVLRLLARGKTVSDIGGEIALSVKTVSTYRARILEKLQLRTTAELIRYAVDHHLTD